MVTGGCSFIFVSGPAKEAPGRYEPAGCTRSRFCALAGLRQSRPAEGYGVFQVLGQTDAQYEGPGRFHARSTRGSSSGRRRCTPLSAMYGFSTVATCREIRDQSVIPFEPAPAHLTRAERRSDEAAEEAAVQARLREKAAADAKAEKRERRRRREGGRRKPPDARAGPPRPPHPDDYSA